MECPLCERVQKITRNEYPYLIHEFEHSYLMLGEHQFYRGYCVLVSKGHHVEMADIRSPVREEIFQELMKSSKLLQEVFNPKKMNLCSLGNVVPHLHWHLFPRYADDQNFSNPPWLHMDKFESARVTPVERDKLVEVLKTHLSFM
jgi:diadenosine tetraphosphate (Ap4A) HIT family hydrolase